MKAGSEKSPALVDSNILVYAYAEDSPKQGPASELLKKCFSGNIALSLSLQNIGEFCDVAIRKYKLDMVLIRRIVRQLLYSSSFVKISYSATEFEKALDFTEKQNMQFWDAVLAATMKENAIDTIYSEDDDFSKIEGIKVVNPFLCDRPDLQDFEELDKKIKSSATKRFLKR